MFVEKALLTEKELARKERNTAIVAAFQRVKATYPTATNARVANAISKDFGVSSQTILLVVKSYAIA